jgi:hypothetical protein
MPLLHSGKQQAPLKALSIRWAFVALVLLTTDAAISVACARCLIAVPLLLRFKPLLVLSPSTRKFILELNPEETPKDVTWEVELISVGLCAAFEIVNEGGEAGFVKCCVHKAGALLVEPFTNGLDRDSCTLPIAGVRPVACCV